MAPIIIALLFTMSLLSSHEAYAADAGTSASERAFYEGKTIKVVVGFRPGAAYDLYARLAARHLGRYVPGHPAVLVENSVESAAKTAERVYRETAPDGTTLAGLVPSLYFQQLMGKVEGKFDWAGFTWIGSPTKSQHLLYMRGDAPFKTMRDVKESSVAPVCGAGEESTTGYYLPRLFEEALGTKFKIVAGYKEGPDVDSAVERGELQCRAHTIDGIFSH